MSPLKPLASGLSVVTAVAMGVVGSGTATAADVSLPTVEGNRVSVRIENPIGPILTGQSCAGALIPLYNLPAVAAEAGPLLDGGLPEIIAALGELSGLVTLLRTSGLIPSPITTPGRPGTLTAANVADDFYLVPVVCLGGRNNAPRETNLFLTQVGSPLDAFTGSVGASGSAGGEGIDLGSAQLDVGSADGRVDLGSAAGPDLGSALAVGVQGSLAEATTGSVGLEVDAGSTGSDVGIEWGRGSLETDSTAGLDTASLSSGIEPPSGSGDGTGTGSSIDVGSVIPVATELVGSIQGLPGA